MRCLDLVDDWVQLARKSRYDANALAAALQISRSQLRRWFQEVCGSTPQEWLNEVRLWHALEMVCAGTPTKVVAAELNFGSASLFCRRYAVCSCQRLDPRGKPQRGAEPRGVDSRIRRCRPLLPVT